MMKVYIPHYYAEIIRQRFGSLENYSRERWNGALLPVDSYQEEFNRKLQASINEKLSRQWSLVSETKVMYQNRRQTRDA